MSGHYAARPALFPLTGGCACGLIRYRIEKAPIVVHCCHCTSCQRETGTAFALNAIIETSLVTSIPPSKPTVPASKADPCKPALPELTTAPCKAAANLILTPSESGTGQLIARCPRCAVAVWSHYGNAARLLSFVRVGTLDRGFEVDPDVHIYVSSKRDFVELSDGKPQFEKFYPSASEVYRPESVARLEVLLPKIQEVKEEAKKKGSPFKD